VRERIGERSETLRNQLISVGILLSCTLVGTGVAQESQTSVTQTSPNHTTIVIHDYSPQAVEARERQAERALERLEEKRRREAEFQSDDYQARETLRERNRASLAPIAVRQKRNEYQPPHFFNGGYYTGAPLGGFGFGFGPGFGYGYGLNSGYGFNRGFARNIYPGTYNQFPGVYQGGRFRGGFRGGYRGGFRGGYRGGFCR